MFTCLSTLVDAPGYLVHAILWGLIWQHRWPWGRVIDCCAFGDAAEKSGDLIVGFFPLKPDDLHVSQQGIAIIPELIYALFEGFWSWIRPERPHRCLYTLVHKPVSNLCESLKHARIVPPP